MTTVDAIVVGGSANALVAAHLIAKTGRRVVVLDEGTSPDGSDAGECRNPVGKAGSAEGSTTEAQTDVPPGWLTALVTSTLLPSPEQRTRST